jgi:hypothetical protein
VAGAFVSGWTVDVKAGSVLTMVTGWLAKLCGGLSSITVHKMIKAAKTSAKAPTKRRRARFFRAVSSSLIGASAIGEINGA